LAIDHTALFRFVLTLLLLPEQRAIRGGRVEGGLEGIYNTYGDRVHREKKKVYVCVCVCVRERERERERETEREEA